MTTPTRRRVRWLLAFSAFVALGLPWLLGSPPFFGADEGDIARRAAAVAEGEWTGEKVPGVDYIVTVTVPGAFGVAAGDQAACWADYPLPEARVPVFPPPEATCPRWDPPNRPEQTTTVQYRGQPFVFGVVGLAGRLAPNRWAPTAQRVALLLATAALLASAAGSALGSRRPKLAGALLLASWAPATVFLSATTNPSALEVAAALGAWLAAARLATDDEVEDRLLHRFGVAALVLTLGRGLGPGFLAMIVAVAAVLAGAGRCRDLIGRRVVWAWAAGLGAASAVSAAWVLWIQREFPLAPNTGVGALDAVSRLPWYLRQMTGVFGSNTVALPAAATWLWWVLAGAVFVVALLSASARGRVAAVAVLVGGLALNVSASGLVIPNIGFYWQGRYSLPALLGGFAIAAVTAGTGRSTAAPAVAAERATPFVVGTAVAGFAVLHVAGFLRMASFAAGRTDLLPLADVLRGDGWQPPLGFSALTVLLVVGVALVLVATIAPTLVPAGEIDPPVPAQTSDDTDPRAER
jgi:hypothetical protein